MEKALDILNNIYFDDRNIMCVEKSTALDVFNAIKELEEAMKPKTCDWCEYLDGVICRHDRGLYCVRQFEADYFKSKDNE